MCEYAKKGITDYKHKSVCLFVCCLGSGGNNHAADYYKETKYPLAVKLGTITPDGAGNYWEIKKNNSLFSGIIADFVHL